MSRENVPEFNRENLQSGPEKILREQPEIQGRPGRPKKLDAAPAPAGGQAEDVRYGQFQESPKTDLAQQRVLDWDHRKRATTYNSPEVKPNTKTPSELAVQLGAGRYSDREDAATALESLGKTALSDLRSALNSADQEVRTRAKGLVDKIELRETLIAGKPLIKASEDLQPADGKDPPANWSEIADNFVAMGKKIDKDTLSRAIEKRKGVDEDGNTQALDSKASD